MERGRITRWAAPVAFLAAVTIGALVVRAGLQQGGQHRATSPTTTVISKTKKKKTHPPPHKGHHRTYTIQSGDTLGSIASKIGTTIARLEQLNPGIDPTALHVGQTIRVQ
ncbi:MAG TPA: LysM peptidoglycan-binding domain-containing protein [Gaiellaceae bacterium]|nr:LysM peptidoglycan-binding domain-containing protein [Gaiellaceae bacterium]